MSTRLEAGTQPPPLRLRALWASAHLATLVVLLFAVGEFFSRLPSTSWDAFFASLSTLQVMGAGILLVSMVSCLLSPQPSIRTFARFLLIVICGAYIAHWILNIAAGQ